MAKTPKAQATAQRIADAAAALFAQEGYQATTVTDVAEAAAVAPGTVMLHFGSKSQLATAAFADHIAAVVSASRPTGHSASLVDDLLAFVTPIYEWYSQSASFAPDLLREALFSDGPWAEHYADTVTHTVEAFAFIIAGHVEADAPIALLAEGMLADYLLVLFQGLRGRFDAVADQAEHFGDLAASRFQE